MREKAAVQKKSEGIRSKKVSIFKFVRKALKGDSPAAMPVAARESEKQTRQNFRRKS
jgi:hypothetical protein